MNKDDGADILPGSSDTAVSGRHSTGGRLLTSCTQRNSQDELDQRDVCSRHECLKLVKELNREVTAYRSLLLGLGSVGDCEQLREDLKRTRRKAQMSIKEVKTRLVPWLTCHSDGGTHPEWGRIWTIFVCCMDVLQTEMAKTLTLQQTFCLYSDSCSLINAGWNGNDAGVKAMADNLSLDVFLEKMYIEREETMQLERELVDLHQVVEELRTIIKVKIPISESMDSISLPGNNNRFPSTLEQGAPRSERSSSVGERGCQRSCLCWAIVTTIVTFVVATVLGVCIVFLS